jgi:ribosomal-protein-alanine N-acetyltransferase
VSPPVRGDRTEADGGDLLVAVEPMRRRHLRAVLRIEEQIQPHGWSLGLFLAELRRGTADRRYLVARVGSTVVGYAGVLFVAGDAHVTTVGVHPDWQGRGVGTRLVVTLARLAVARGNEALTLEVRAGNERAIALYRRIGMAPAGVRKGYYEDDGEDALILWCHDLADAGYPARLDAVDATIPGATVVDGLSELTDGAVTGGGAARLAHLEEEAS